MARAWSGADAVCEAIRDAGVAVVFGYPGGAIMPLYDALRDHPLHHVLVRHEANAGFAADGWARLTGGPGVVIATSGPGATNLATPLASAFADSVPVVAITGQVSSALVGTDAFQETDVTGLLLPVTKWSALVRSTAELVPALRRAFATAVSGRPGPVLLDICKDVQQAPLPRNAWTGHEAVPSRAATIDPAALAAVEALLGATSRPVILAGHGVIQSGAQRALQALAERWDSPVATTLLGIGAIAEDHPLCLGMMGMHGDVHVNAAIDSADLILAVGMRFDDRVTGDLASYAARARVIHVDIDAAEIGKNVRPDIALVCDARAALCALATLPAPRRDPTWSPAQHRGSLAAQLGNLPEDVLVAPRALADLDSVAADDAVVVTDVGQHQMWEAQFVTHGRRTLLTSGGAGAMGYALGAAMGAALAAPHREVWAVCGDGGFQMSSCELSTLAQESLDVRVVVVNNGYLGMVRQWQELFHERRYSHTRISGPDLVALAAAHGIPAHRAATPQECKAALQRARAARGPVLVELRVAAEHNVLPMIAPGRPISEMIVPVPPGPSPSR